jgi:hypothetical protein
MSEQDKRPLYMGTYERHRKELQVKHDDLVTQIIVLKRLSKYHTIMAGLALGIALGALAM